VLLRREKRNGQFNYDRCKQQGHVILFQFPTEEKKKEEEEIPVLLIFGDGRMKVCTARILR
jgi:hypothetical protein